LMIEVGITQRGRGKGKWRKNSIKKKQKDA